MVIPMPDYKILTREVSIPMVGTWFCGYVGVSPQHPLHGEDYDYPLPSIDKNELPINHSDPIGTILAMCQDVPPKLAYVAQVHGGITYAGDSVGDGDGYWYFGFDCNHACDMDDPKDEAFVLAECEKLKAFLISLEGLTV